LNLCWAEKTKSSEQREEDREQWIDSTRKRKGVYLELVLGGEGAEVLHETKLGGLREEREMKVRRGSTSVKETAGCRGSKEGEERERCR
jgi:hypothetical protein